MKVTRNPTRARALSPYLERLERWDAGSGDDEQLEQAARIRVGSQSLVLDGWERTQIRQAFRCGDDEVQGVPALLVEGAALMTKSLVDIERLAAQTPAAIEALYALQAELMLDAAIGMALDRETRLAVERLESAGHAEDSRGLAGFHHKIDRVVSSVKKKISESERNRAESIAQEISAAPIGVEEVTPAEPVEPPPPDPTPVNPLEDLSRDIDREIRTLHRRRKPAERRPAPGPPRPVARAARKPVTTETGEGAGGLLGQVPPSTRVLGMILAALIVVWMIVGFSAGLGSSPRLLTEPDLGHAEVLVKVTPRPPSLYATVGPEWEALSDQGRLDIVQDLSDMLDRHGYEGLLIREADGRPVAQWMRQGGAELLEDGEAAPVSRTTRFAAPEATPDPPPPPVPDAVVEASTDPALDPE